jgi:ketol-acid reductoisomerase
MWEVLEEAKEAMRLENERIAEGKKASSIVEREKDDMEDTEEYDDDDREATIEELKEADRRGVASVKTALGLDPEGLVEEGLTDKF